MLASQGKLRVFWALGGDFNCSVAEAAAGIALCPQAAGSYTMAFDQVRQRRDFIVMKGLKCKQKEPKIPITNWDTQHVAVFLEGDPWQEDASALASTQGKDKEAQTIGSDLQAKIADLQAKMKSYGPGEWSDLDSSSDLDVLSTNKAMASGEGASSASLAPTQGGHGRSAGSHEAQRAWAALVADFPGSDKPPPPPPGQPTGEEMQPRPPPPEYRRRKLTRKGGNLGGSDEEAPPAKRPSPPRPADQDKGALAPTQDAAMEGGGAGGAGGAGGGGGGAGGGGGDHEENEAEETKEEGDKEEEPAADYGGPEDEGGSRQLAVKDEPAANPAAAPNIRYVTKEENVYRFSMELNQQYLAGGGGWGEALAPTQGITWGEALLAFKSKSSERRKETLERRALHKRLRATVRLWASGNYSFEELD